MLKQCIFNKFLNKIFKNFQKVFWIFFKFLWIFLKFFEYFLEIFWIFFGNFLNIFWKNFLKSVPPPKKILATPMLLPKFCRSVEKIRKRRKIGDLSAKRFYLYIEWVIWNEIVQQIFPEFSHIFLKFGGSSFKPQSWYFSSALWKFIFKIGPRTLIYKFSSCFKIFSLKSGFPPPRPEPREIWM